MQASHCRCRSTVGSQIALRQRLTSAQHTVPVLAAPFRHRNTHRYCSAAPVYSHVAAGVPIYVALENDVVLSHGKVSYMAAVSSGLRALAEIGVTGVEIEVWWGLVEFPSPRQYDWALYHKLFRLVMEAGLSIKVVLCFHSGSSILLPPWVMEVGSSEPNIFYADSAARHCFDCLSLGVDHVRVFEGRSALQLYGSFIHAFHDEFRSLFGSTIHEVTVGLGPNGELRYPSYRYDEWEFPGIGQFQCYDKFMMSSMRAAAYSIGRPEFALDDGPHDAGHYCMWPYQTPFFCDGGGWMSDYGRFVLQWLSEALLAHGHDVLSMAAQVMRRSSAGRRVRLQARLPAVHWWYNTASHAAELTAGIYHTRYRDGYLPIFNMLSKLGVGVQLTCAEMSNCTQPPLACCNPEQQLAHMRAAAASQGVAVSLANAQLCFDEAAFAMVERHLFDEQYVAGICVPETVSFTYHRMCDAMFEPASWRQFKAAVQRITSRSQQSMQLTVGGNGNKDPAVL